MANKSSGTNAPNVVLFGDRRAISICWHFSFSPGSGTNWRFPQERKLCQKHSGSKNGVEDVHRTNKTMFTKRNLSIVSFYFTKRRLPGNVLWARLPLLKKKNNEKYRHLPRLNQLSTPRNHRSLLQKTRLLMYAIEQPITSISTTP